MFIWRVLQVISYLRLAVLVKVVNDMADGMNFNVFLFRNDTGAIESVWWTITIVLAGDSGDYLFCFKPIGPSIVFAIEGST